MSCYLGIDTSNYTTSAALYDTLEGVVGNERRLLTVKDGELGLRQSDAVFQHTLALPALLQALFAAKRRVDGIGVSIAPRDAQGSYMPCFMTGKAVAESLAAATGVPLYTFSHQTGHIAAAALSAGKRALLRQPFLAFHVSGGTTEAVYVVPDTSNGLLITPLVSSLDLKAGQAVDRVGRLLSIPFPAGPALEALALKSDRRYTPKPFARDGNVSLSGLENRCAAMYAAGEKPEDIARYCLDSITAALLVMLRFCTQSHPGLPLLFSGGVLSNSIIRAAIGAQYDAVFASPALSSDNAVGIAYLAAYRDGQCGDAYE